MPHSRIINKTPYTFRAWCINDTDNTFSQGTLGAGDTGYIIPGNSDGCVIDDGQFFWPRCHIVFCKGLHDEGLIMQSFHVGNNANLEISGIDNSGLIVKGHDVGMNGQIVPVKKLREGYNGIQQAIMAGEAALTKLDTFTDKLLNKADKTVDISSNAIDAYNNYKTNGVFKK